MQTFPMLYRKTNTGAIQQWSVYASEMVPDVRDRRRVVDDV